MTREEAIQELQNCKGLIQQDGQDYLDDRDIPLLDMAIEALSADIAFIPVPKNCAECWKKCLHVAVDCNAKGDCGWDGDERAEDCPIARPHGEWEYHAIVTASDTPMHHIWKCNRCECEGNPDMNFCPNCGAKMGGDGE